MAIFDEYLGEIVNGCLLGRGQDAQIWIAIEIIVRVQVVIARIDREIFVAIRVAMIDTERRMMMIADIKRMVGSNLAFGFHECRKGLI